jgi:hypothetical protein
MGAASKVEEHPTLIADHRLNETVLPHFPISILPRRYHSNLAAKRRLPFDDGHIARGEWRLQNEHGDIEASVRYHGLDLHRGSTCARQELN